MDILTDIGVSGRRVYGSGNIFIKDNERTRSEAAMLYGANENGKTLSEVLMKGGMKWEQSDNELIIFAFDGDDYGSDGSIDDVMLCLAPWAEGQMSFTSDNVRAWEITVDMSPAPKVRMKN